jgi:hypothetical protein
VKTAFTAFQTQVANWGIRRMGGLIERASSKEASEFSIRGKLPQSASHDEINWRSFAGWCRSAQKTQLNRLNSSGHFRKN